MVAVETGNLDFLEIGGELSKENCEIDTFQAGFYDTSFILITFIASSLQRTTLVVRKILVKNEICRLYIIA